jgi:allantoate deiminase
MPTAAREFTALDLAQRLAKLGEFGTADPGVTRLVYDPSWRAAHRWMSAEAETLGLRTTSDWAGNLYLHDPAFVPDGSQRALLIGSHLDSVVRGGRYDGAYGAITGLLVAAALRNGPGTKVVGFVTAEEEDSRFHGGMMGARALLGDVREAELDDVRDADGVTWREAVAEAHADGAAGALPLELPTAPLVRPIAALELHIEQGPVLEAEGTSLGIVTHIAGYRRWRARFDGEARHSGTTPMTHRKDALTGSAEVVLALEALARESGEPVVGTAGRIGAGPGLFNVVPGDSDVWLELRCSDSATLDRLGHELAQRVAAIANRRALTVSMELVSSQSPEPLDPALADRAESVARDLGVSHRRMVSGAAHDTMVTARAGIPSLLLFVPSRAGISHSPDEHTEPEALWTGFRVVLELCRRLQAEGAA